MRVPACALLPALLPGPRCSIDALRSPLAQHPIPAALVLAFPSLASHPCPSGQRLCRSELDLPALPLLPFSFAKGLVKVVDVSQK